MLIVFADDFSLRSGSEHVRIVRALRGLLEQAARISAEQDLYGCQSERLDLRAIDFPEFSLPVMSMLFARAGSVLRRRQQAAGLPARFLLLSSPSVLLRPSTCGTRPAGLMESGPEEDDEVGGQERVQSKRLPRKSLLRAVTSVVALERGRWCDDSAQVDFPR